MQPLFILQCSIEQTFNLAIERLYGESLKLLIHIGRIKKGDKASAVIEADVQGADITEKLKKTSRKSTQITISARKYLLPKKEIAAGILYQIDETSH